MTSEVEQQPMLLVASYGQHRSPWVKINKMYCENDI